MNSPSTLAFKAVILGLVVLLPEVAHSQRPNPQLIAHVITAANQASNELASRKSKLPIVEGRPLTQAIEEPRKGYAATDVESLLQTTKNTFSEQLAGEDWAPIRSYVDAFFPLLTEDKAAAQTIGFGKFGRVVSTGFADSQFVEARDVIFKIRYAVEGWAPLSLDLRVVTIPSGAEITLQPASGGRLSTTTSDSEFRNIYRGYYKYRVVLSGFKSVVDGIVNLIDDDRRTLECTLRKSDNQSSPSFCIRK